MCIGLLFVLDLPEDVSFLKALWNSGLEISPRKMTSKASE
jgi:hypothetical protein